MRNFRPSIIALAGFCACGDVDAPATHAQEPEHVAGKQVETSGCDHDCCGHDHDHDHDHDHHHAHEHG